MDKLTFIKSLFCDDNGGADQNKSIANFGALIGGIVCIILSIRTPEYIDIPLSIFMISVLGQRPLKGLHDLGRLKIAHGDDKNGRNDYVTDMNVTDINGAKKEDRQ